MRPFTYLRVVDASAAVASVTPGAAFVAGGTALLDLMKLDVERPEMLVDISRLPLAEIEEHRGGLRIGALARNADVALDPRVAKRFPVLAEALHAGASPQLRNMATVGGNLLQRTRCSYFRDPAVATCNKRAPGTGCAAWDGENRMHAIFGGSERCIATHPSDMCVALVALDAVVQLRGPTGARDVPIADFHLPAGERPEVESVLAPGELVTHVVLPPSRFAARSTYLKVRDRASFAFALASAAVALDVSGGVIREARVALGGVGTKPWRSQEAEQALRGQPASERAFRAAAEAALRGAQPREHNRFKVELARRTLLRALTRIGGGP